MFQPYTLGWSHWFKKTFAMSVMTNSADNIESYSASAAWSA